VQNAKRPGNRIAARAREEPKLKFVNLNHLMNEEMLPLGCNVDHDWLMKMLEQRTADKRVLRLARDIFCVRELS